MKGADMETIAFRMRLHRGRKDEYRRRHDAIWPALADALRAAGIADYWIFLDDETDCLFAVLKRPAGHRMAELAQADVMRRWWAYMADLMATDEDGRPLEKPLEPMFHLA